MADILIIQSSLNPDSKTAIVLKEVEKQLQEQNMSFETIDLRNLNLEFCNGQDTSKYNQDIQNAYKKMQQAKAYIIGMPVYQFSYSGVLKNFLDITGKAMKDKHLSIVANAGGPMSYLATADLMKATAFFLNVTTLQPIVYTSRQNFDDNKLTAEKPLKKIKEMITTLQSVI